MNARDYINTNSVMLDGDWESLHKIIDDSKAEKIVKWLHKTYGLQVYKTKETTKPTNPKSSVGSSTNQQLVCMAYGDGFHVCDVYATTKECTDLEGVPFDETTYFYTSPFNLRDRWSSSYTMDTRASKTITNLIKIIKKIVPTESSVNTKVTSGFCELKETIEKTVLGSSYKTRYSSNSELDDNMTHALLQRVLGGNKVIEHELDIELATKILAEWDNTDITLLEKHKVSSQFLDNPLIVLGINTDGTYMIGTIQTQGINTRNRDFECTILTPFKRINKYTLKDYPMVQAMVTMFSVVNEYKEKCIEFIPRMGGYNTDLNVISLPTYTNYGESTPTGGMGWLLMQAN